MPAVQITTMTLFTVEGLKNRFYALRNMGMWPSQVSNVSGLQFSKLMGVGSGNGFSVIPDFGRYAWMAVWESEEAADTFFASHEAWKSYNLYTSSFSTFKMKNTMAHGSWGGSNPFVAVDKFQPEKKVAVLTRATIHWKDMLRFWKDVPSVSRSLGIDKPPILAVGVGELPFRYQATFSIWENGEEMMAYAYQHAAHRRMVEKTRKIGWYKEELFARFSLMD